ncbi:Hypothetical protein SMAX5B_018527 [Scophthalmus maximus]|uniref:Uncharacterized protein n=1 Tax=Scophthalmus maximus TaxID=52904 RepID=A0A2U9C8I3_SCOMX|nr:Hypothetical protein SMAX5B_018527 [Scophthalmus maximus]
MPLTAWRGLECGQVVEHREPSRDIGNKLTRPSLLSHSSFRPERCQPAGRQPIYLGEDEDVREVPAGTIPEDILECDETHREKN